MAQPNTGLYVYGQNKFYDPSKEMDILKFNDWAKNNPKAAAKYGARDGVFNGSTPATGLTSNELGTNTNPLYSGDAQTPVNAYVQQPIKSGGLTGARPLGVEEGSVADFSGPSTNIYDGVKVNADEAATMGLTAGSYTPDQLSTASQNYNNFLSYSPETQAAMGAADAKFDANNAVTGMDYTKLNGFFNTDGTVDAGKFSSWAEYNPEAAAGLGGSLSFDGDVGKFNGLTSKDNTFLGVGNEGWGNILKGGGLVMQGIGLRDTLKTNKKQREAMDFDLMNARAEKAALDKYRAAYA